MKRKIISALCLIIAIISTVFFGGCTQPRLTVGEIFSSYEKSLVCIEFNDGVMWKKATALALDYDGETVTALTCYHAINTTISSAQAKFYGGDIEPVNAQTYEVVGYSEKLDLALIRIKNSDYSGHAVSLNKFRDLSANPLKVAENAFVIGNEMGEGITMDCGYIKMVEDIKRCYEHTKPLIRVGVSFTPGYSGGVVVDDNGEIIGIAVGNDGDNANRGYALSASIAKAFVTRVIADANHGEIACPTFSVSNEEYADDEIFRNKTVITLGAEEYEFSNGTLVNSGTQYDKFNGKQIPKSVSEFIALIILSQTNFSLS